MKLTNDRHKLTSDQQGWTIGEFHRLPYSSAKFYYHENQHCLLFTCVRLLVSDAHSYAQNQLR
jgi:hypothetical protein